MRRRGVALNDRLAELVLGERTELQRAVLAADWSQTPLGPVATWSPTLLTAVSTVLNSRFAMMLAWGPELTLVFNDAYTPMLGARHPGALGRSMAEVWSDVWADVQGLVTDVLAGRSTYAEDLPLTMTRHGFAEETWFTFSYSPVVEPEGRVAGLLNTVVESTPRVLSARRMGVLQQLGSLPRSVHGSTEAAAVAALRVLADADADCPFGVVYLLEDDEAGARRTASYGVDPAGALSDAVLQAAVRQAVTTGAVVPVGDLGARLPGIADAGPVGSAGVETAFALPLTAAGRDRPIGALVLGVSPHLRVDAEYLTFLQLAAGQVAAAVADAQAVLAERRRAAERAELDRSRAQFFTEVAVTLQRAVLGPTVLPTGFAVHYEPAAGTLEVGGDWYDVVDLPGGSYGVVVGDVVGRGLDAAAVMGQLRSAGRALLLESRSPAHVLSALDRFAALVPGAICSTVFCGIVDPAAATLRYSSAGHPPAVLVDDQGRAQLLEGARGVPLAVLEGVQRPEAQVSLPPGSTLLLYTDGLVERRDEALDEGIDRAVQALVAGRHLASTVLADLLTDQLLSDAPDDDVAFLLYRSPG
ncbi:SpoIIE family protein phosphatase [Modestobacter sp. L9-4]|uniref:SpoIIE family protein phosphatase n=1 Tax=Modestobacter sp. L9-4 TaxID=2851567 RepID=UPI001C76B1B8|nr:SpoIIE family protein phosphatase [Modestobacter sp. L9-4]QXG74453.1 SpoIIE family protein phosphatase [Modestobacter sp. L9-4]